MSDRQGGRPVVGPRIYVRVRDEQLPAIDAYAAEHDLVRAEAVRQLLDVGIRATTRRTPPS